MLDSQLEKFSEKRSLQCVSPLAHNLVVETHEQKHNDFIEERRQKVRMKSEFLISKLSQFKEVNDRNKQENYLRLREKITNRALSLESTLNIS